MEHLPPPFFKQGPSVFATLAIITLLVDARFNLLRHARQGIAVVLYPIQQMVRVPRAILLSGGQYFQDISVAQSELRQAKQQLLTQGQQAQLAQQLAQENTQLRRLLGIRENMATPSLSAQILYEAHDPFTRKLILDKGILEGVQAGQPVIDDQGVVGQITRTFVKTAEVTLLTDRDQAIPVQIIRNGLRSVAYGGQEPGLLDLRFMAGNADVQHAVFGDNGGLRDDVGPNHSGDQQNADQIQNPWRDAEPTIGPGCTRTVSECRPWHRVSSLGEGIVPAFGCDLKASITGRTSADKSFIRTVNEVYQFCP